METPIFTSYLMLFSFTKNQKNKKNNLKKIYNFNLFKLHIKYK